MPGVSEGTKRLVVWMMNTDRGKRPRRVAEILTRMKSAKARSSSYDEATVLSDDTEEATVVVERQHSPRQEASRPPKDYPPAKDRRSTPQNATKEPEAEFSIVGCLYILIIIAIVVGIVKFLFWGLRMTIPRFAPHCIVIHNNYKLGIY